MKKQYSNMVVDGDEAEGNTQLCQCLFYAA